MAMKKPFAAFDIDGTLVRWQLYHAIADSLVHLGYFSKDDYQSVKEARMGWKKRTHEKSFKDYEQHLVYRYDHLLKSLTVRQFEEAANIVFGEYKDQVYTYTRDLIKKLKTGGYLLFAISGSQAEIVKKFADYYGFDDFVGSTYQRRGPYFTGKKIVSRGGKHLLLQKLIRQHQASEKGSIGVGDSEGDVTMLATVEQAICFNPTKELFAVAKQRGWLVVVERKNVVYELRPNNGTYLLA